MIPREEVALYVRGYLEDEKMECTLTAFDNECKLKLPEAVPAKKLCAVLAEHKELCGASDELDTPQLWKRLDVLLGHLRYLTMPRAPSTRRSQHYRSKRGNSILHDQRRGVQPFTVMLQQDTPSTWQQQQQQQVGRDQQDNNSIGPCTPQPPALQSPAQQLSLSSSSPSSASPTAAGASSGLVGSHSMTICEESSQLPTSLSTNRTAYAAPPPTNHLRSPRRKSTRPQRKQPITESPIKDRLRKPVSADAAEHLVETILSQPSLQSKLAEGINHHVVGNSSVSEASVSPPSQHTNAAQVAGAVSGQHAVDAAADDTVSRVLEWMQTDPAFGSLPWENIETNTNTSTESGHLSNANTNCRPNISTPDPLNSLLLSPSKLTAAAAAAAASGDSCAGGAGALPALMYSPLQGSLIDNVLGPDTASSLSNLSLPSPMASLLSTTAAVTSSDGGLSDAVRSSAVHVQSNGGGISSASDGELAQHLASQALASLANAAVSAISSGSSGSSGDSATAAASNATTASQTGLHGGGSGTDTLDSLHLTTAIQPPSSRQQPAHVRSLDFSSPGSVPPANMASFVQKTVFAAMLQPDINMSGGAGVTAAAGVSDTVLVHSTSSDVATTASTASRMTLANGDMSTTDNASSIPVSGMTVPGNPSKTQSTSDPSSSLEAPPKKKKKKKKSKRGELDVFPANVDVDGFLSQLSYD